MDSTAIYRECLAQSGAEDNSGEFSYCSQLADIIFGDYNTPTAGDANYMEVGGGSSKVDTINGETVALLIAGNVYVPRASTKLSDFSFVSSAC